MTSNYKAAGVDLDSLFMARVNTKRADVGFDVAGIDVSNRWETIGDGTPRANVNYKAGGIDLAQLFRDIGDPLETVTVSGESVTGLKLSGTATAGIRVNADGTIDKNQNGIYSQIDAATDWIIPNGSASSLYEVRVTSVTGSFSNAAAAPNTWINLGSNREWNVIQVGEGSSTASFTLEIRYDGGAVLDSGTYFLTATIEP